MSTRARYRQFEEARSLTSAPAAQIRHYPLVDEDGRAADDSGFRAWIQASRLRLGTLAGTIWVVLHLGLLAVRGRFGMLALVTALFGAVGFGLLASRFSIRRERSSDISGCCARRVADVPTSKVSETVR